MTGQNRDTDPVLERVLRRWFAEHPAPPAPTTMRLRIRDATAERSEPERLNPTMHSFVSPPGRTGPHRLGVAIVALALVAAGIGAVMVASRPALRAGPSRSIPTTTASSSASSAPTGSTASASPLPVLSGFTTSAPTAVDATWTGLTWKKLIPSDPLALVRQIVHGSAGYLALGSPIIDVGQAVTTLWFSAEGVTWQTISPSTLGGAPFVLAIGQVGNTFVAITATADTSGCDGALPGMACAEPGAPLTSWTSTDRRAWSAHAGPILDPRGLGPGASLASGPDGLLAFVTTIGPSIGSTAMATSPDGTVWTSVPAGNLPVSMAT